MGIFKFNKILLPAILTFSLFSITALAQVQNHPLSQVRGPFDVNLNMSGTNITNTSYIFFGNNSVDTYLYRSGTNTLQTASHLVVAGGWVNSTGLNVSGTTNVSINSPTLFVDRTNSRVGIGTTSPLATMHVEGLSIISSSGTGSGSYAGGLVVDIASAAYTSGTDVTGTNRHLSLLSGTNNRGVTLSLRNTARNIFWDIVAQGTGNDRLDFNTYNAGVYSTRFTLEGSSGNVGINTTSPNALLNVMTHTTDTKVAANISNYGSGNSFVVEDVAADTTPFVIDSAGLVGIGTTVPQDLLNVVGGDINITTGNLTLNGTGVVGILFDDGTFLSSGTTTGATGWTDDGTVVRLTTSTDLVGIGTSTVSTGTALNVSGGNVTIDEGTLFVDSTNNWVGMGTTAPNSTLHIRPRSQNTTGLIVTTYVQPTDIAPSNLQFWVSADMIKNVSDGSAVAQWDDSSGNNRDATQATAADQPIYRTNALNGSATVAFISSDKMGFTSFSSGTSHTVFWVAKYDRSKGDNAILGRDSDSNQAVLQVCGTGCGSASYSAGAGNGVTFVPSNLDFINNTYNILMINRSGTNVSFFRNGGQESTTQNLATDTAITIDTISVSGDSRHFQGNVSEIIIYNTNLTTSEIQQIEGYLANKYNMLNSLPSTHPYRATNNQSTSRYPLTIDRDGNVAIGNTTPGAKLDVQVPVGTSTATAVRIRNSNNATGFNGLLINTENTATGTYALDAQSGGTSRLYVRSDGRVGIGTTTPTETLSVVGSANISTWLNASSLNITGTNNVSIDSPTFFVDATNNRVGIGTTTPGYVGSGGQTTLTMRGRAADDFGFLELVAPSTSGTGASGQIEFINLNGSTVAVSRAIIRALRDGADDAVNLVFHTQPTGGGPIERLRITSTGLVGINTTSPQALLQVATVSSSSTDAVNITNLGTGDSFVVEDVAADTSPFLINNAGNVGIGTVTPGYLLEIANSSTALNVSGILFVNGTGASGLTNGVVSIGTAYPRIWDTGIGSILEVNGGTGGNSPYIQFVDTSANADDWAIGNVNGDLTFRNLDNGGYIAAFKDDTNNFGIGTTSPSVTLDVRGNFNASLGNFSTGTGDTVAALNITNLGSNYSLIVMDAAGDTTPFVISASGRVGIGNATPRGKLHVASGNTNSLLNSGADDLVIESTGESVGLSILTDTNQLGNIYFGNSDDGAEAAISWNPATDLWRYNVGGATAGTIEYRIGSAGAFNITTTGGAASLLLANNDGNIGINDITPDTTLEVVNVSTTEDLFMLSSRRDNDGDRFIVTNAGNVGINTTAPTSLVNIVSGGTQGALNITNGTGSSVFYVNASSGRVGIGTANTSAFLHIAGDNLEHIFLEKFGADADGAEVQLRKTRGANSSAHSLVSDADIVGRLQFSASDGASYIGLAEIRAFVNGTPGTNDMPGGLRFYTTLDGGTTSTERMRIDTNGLVAIGDADTGSSAGRYVRFDADGVATHRNDDNAIFNYFILQNLANQGSDGRTYGGRFIYQLSRGAELTPRDAGTIYVAAENDWGTSDLTDNNAFMGFGVSTDNAFVREVLRITSNGSVTVNSSVNATNVLTLDPTVAAALQSTFSINGNFSQVGVGANVNSSFDGNTLFIDGTNNRVGIGTNNASSEFHIVGVNPTYRIQTNTDTGQTRFTFADESNIPRWNFGYQDTTGDFKISEGTDGALDTTTRITIDNGTGNVGIGTISPRSLLHVAGEVQLTLDGDATGNQAVCGNTSTGDAADTANVLLSDCPGTPVADYMEMYSTELDVEPGDIVTTGMNYVTTKNGDRIVKLTKSSSPYQQTIIGIVSNPDDAGDFNSIGYNIKEEDNPMPIALSGRVKVKVSDEGGVINAGDYLTSSSISGTAMKASKGGRVIGIALESFGGKSGKILMFVNVHENLAPKLNELTLENSQLKLNIDNLESRLVALESRISLK